MQLVKTTLKCITEVLMRQNPFKILWLISAFLTLTLGAVGIFLPVVPTTPFLLLSSFCFARGSERFHRWFLGTNLYQKHLDSFVKERAMTLRTKLCILLPASAMLIIAMVLMSSLPFRILIIFLILFKTACQYNTAQNCSRCPCYPCACAKPLRLIGHRNLMGALA